MFISNPSFETWLLCHCRTPTHPYEPAELLEDLSTAIGSDYKKSTGMAFGKNDVDTAIKNASKLLPLEMCSAKECFDRNPSTMVHSLAKMIRDKSEVLTSV